MLPILINGEVFQKLIENIDKEKYVLVDLRSEEKYDLYHIDGAINLKFDFIMKSKYFGDRLTHDKKIIFYCDKGGRSIYAARKLRSMNYDATSLSGGIDNYTRQYKKIPKI